MALALLDATEVGFLLRADRAAYAHGEELGIARDGIEWRAQLVTHRRKELALRHIRRFGSLLRRQRLLVLAGAVDGEGGATRKLHREREIVGTIASPRFRAHEREGAEGAAPHG